jgi:hypothetical protein
MNLLILDFAIAIVIYSRGFITFKIIGNLESWELNLGLVIDQLAASCLTFLINLIKFVIIVFIVQYFFSFCSLFCLRLINGSGWQVSILARHETLLDLLPLLHLADLLLKFFDFSRHVLESLEFLGLIKLRKVNS